MEYIPSQADLEWTLNAIQGTNTWAVPSIGCVLKLDHLNKEFLIFMKEGPTELETNNVEKIVNNLTYLGFTEKGSFVMGGMAHVDQIVAALESIDNQ
jgi:hypothetical protein